MNKNLVIHSLQLVVFLGLQVLLLRNLVLFDMAFCYLYIGFVLFLPIQMPKVMLLLLAFISGIAVDTFYDTIGVNAAAAVLLAYLRPYVLLILTPRDDYEKSDSVNVHVMGWRWFFVYALFLIFIHHLALFFLELGSFRNAGLTLLKVVMSTAFTFLVLVIIQLLFFSGRRSKR
jgi:hypothetical protein